MKQPMHAGVRRRVLAAALALSVLGSMGLVAGTTGAQASTATKLTIGVVHVGSITDAGYNQAEQQGIAYLEAHMKGVKVLMSQNVSEGSQAQYVMQSDINKGAKLIFPMDFGYMYTAYALAGSNPKVDFEQPGGYLTSANFGDYWAASDDVNYALGAAAAKMSKTGKIGFIGAEAIPTILCAAIAFHLGAQSVNPNITTTVIWTGQWVDPTAEAAAVNTLHSDGVDVVGDLVDSPITVIKTAQADHMFVIGYHSGQGASYAPTYWLSSVAFSWGRMFVSMATAVENGTWAKTYGNKDYIAPINSGAVYMAPWGPKVTAAAKNAADAALKKFTSNSWMNPFKGPIYSQNGTLEVPAGKYLSDSAQNYVNWLAKGMIGSAS